MSIYEEGPEARLYQAKREALPTPNPMPTQMTVIVTKEKKEEFPSSRVHHPESDFFPLILPRL